MYEPLDIRISPKVVFRLRDLKHVFFQIDDAQHVVGHVLVIGLCKWRIKLLIGPH